jgi:hypothetical protein
MPFIMIILGIKTNSFILQKYQIIGFSWLQKFVTKNGITVLPQLSYSPNLALLIVSMNESPF